MAKKFSAFFMLCAAVFISCSKGKYIHSAAFTNLSLANNRINSLSINVTPSNTAIHKSSSRLRMGLFQDFFSSTSTRAASSNGTSSSSPKVQLPPDFKVPEPKPLTITSSTDVPALIKSSLALALRLGTGAFVLGWKIDSLFYKEEGEQLQKKYSLSLLDGKLNIRDTSSVLSNAVRPTKTLILYEYDASPYCKRVREMINILDLSVEYRPCPGARQSAFSKELMDKTGRQTVPYLIDPNTNISMFESNDIIQYLVDMYGPQDKSLYDSKALWPITFEQFSILTSTYAALLCNLPASQRQQNARPDNEQMKPIELWGYECSPFVKPVREKLCSLALPHLMISCSRGSKNRDVLFEKTGRFQVPYLIDPNTGIEMFESAEICQYLDSVYTVKEES